MNGTKRSLQLAVIGTFVLLVILLGGYIASGIIIGTKETTIATAPPLYGQIAQSYINGTGNNKVTTVTNYIVLNTHYFDNNSWAIAQFIPKNNQGDNATVVMQKVGSFYQVVLGPGVAFPSNLKPGLPNEVYDYLSNKGLIYEYN